MRLVVSTHDHRVTLDRLLDGVARRGLTVFAQIDHAAGAREVGMELADEVVIVFGNPRAGTPLMQQDARIGLDLPLRVLVWDRGDATVVGYHDPQDLAASYDVGQAAPALAAMASLLAELTSEACG